MNTVAWILLIVIIVMVFSTLWIIYVLSRTARELRNSLHNLHKEECWLDRNYRVVAEKTQRELDSLKNKIYQSSLVSVTKKYVKIGIRLLGTERVLWWNKNYADGSLPQFPPIPESELKTELKRVKEMFKGDKINIIVHRYEVTEKVDPNGGNAADGGITGASARACAERKDLQPATLRTVR